MQDLFNGQNLRGGFAERLRESWVDDKSQQLPNGHRRHPRRATPAEVRRAQDLADVAAHLNRAAGLLDVLRNLADGA